MTNPNSLLKLAEAQYPDKEVALLPVASTFGGTRKAVFIGGIIEYNPYENAEQLVGLIEWLLEKDSMLIAKTKHEYLCDYSANAPEATGKTLTQAIIQAALKVIGMS